jgi:hypothetical protein
MFSHHEPIHSPDTENAKRFSCGVPSVVAQVDEACVIKANSQFWEQMLAMNLGAAASRGVLPLRRPPFWQRSPHWQLDWPHRASHVK